MEQRPTEGKEWTCERKGRWQKVSFQEGGKERRKEGTPQKKIKARRKSEGRLRLALARIPGSRLE